MSDSVRLHDQGLYGDKNLSLNAICRCEASLQKFLKVFPACFRDTRQSIPCMHAGSADQLLREPHRYKRLIPESIRKAYPYLVDTYWLHRMLRLCKSAESPWLRPHSTWRTHLFRGSNHDAAFFLSGRACIVGEALLRHQLVIPGPTNPPCPT
jgi:hypothetical protein